ncbi:MAG: hypothetical protein EOP23_00235 [Hyphomicrobiales bacterium]|nr:MAG: hypothetical protein EOP23_00235 [Hyphomicrobiales bacterium]
MAKIEPTVVTPANTEPVASPPPALGPTLVATAPAETAAPVTDARKLDQLSRIEEKAARIEEKFARYEAVLTRAEASLERSAHKVDAAAGTMDFAAVRGEINALRNRVDATPRAGTLFMTAILTAVLTVILTILVLKFGVPGLFGGLLAR